jgi:RTX calcium-binding nonapeptide repeat (4 copies)
MSLHATNHLRRALVLASCALFALIVPPAAHGAASTATVERGRLTYTGANGDANNVAVTAVGSTVSLTDAGAGVTITPGRGCEAGGATVTCTRVFSLKLALGDGDNFVDADSLALPTTVTTGAGADRIVTGASVDSLMAGDGADWLDAGPGGDTFNAGGGDDVVLARDGALDGVACGAGADTGTDDDKDFTGSDCEGLGEVAPPDPLDPGSGAGDPEPGGEPGGDPTDPADPSDPGDPADPADPSAPVDPSDPADPDAGDPGTGSGDPETVGGGLTGPLNLEPPVVLAQTAPVKKGVASIRIECPADAGRCKGTVEIFLVGNAAKAKAKAPAVLAKRARRRIVRIGRAKFSARAGTKPVVKVRLNRRGRRRVTRRRKVRARVVVTTRTATGEATTTTRTITLAARRTAGRVKGRR